MNTNEAPVAETEASNVEVDFSEAHRALKWLLEDLEERGWWNVAGAVCKLIGGLEEATSLYQDGRSSDLWRFA